MKKRRNYVYGFLGLFLLLFFFNTVSHDYFCHEELHSVCGPLHSIFKNSAPDWAESISFLPPSLPLYTRNHDHFTRPDFIKNIFHPPD